MNAAQLDQTLLTVEQALLGDGLPRRPWFRHEIYAPGSYTGYDVKTMPGICEAIEYRNYPEAQTNIASVTAAINRYASKIDAASTKLR